MDLYERLSKCRLVRRVYRAGNGTVLISCYGSVREFIRVLSNSEIYKDIVSSGTKFLYEDTGYTACIDLSAIPVVGSKILYESNDVHMTFLHNDMVDIFKKLLDVSAKSVEQESMLLYKTSNLIYRVLCDYAKEKEIYREGMGLHDLIVVANNSGLSVPESILSNSIILDMVLNEDISLYIKDNSAVLNSSVKEIFTGFNKLFTDVYWC